MNLQEFTDNHYEDGEAFSEVDGITFKSVYYDEYAEHKTVTTTQVFHLVGTEDYFEVTQDRDNCGYWGDGERYDPTFRKVKPVKRMVEITEWKDA